VKLVPSTPPKGKEQLQSDLEDSSPSAQGGTIRIGSPLAIAAVAQDPCRRGSSLKRRPRGYSDPAIRTFRWLSAVPPIGGGGGVEDHWE